MNEPLEISAPLARQRAQELCHQDPVSRQSCSWNHGLWQYLRLLGLITTPWHHAEFFKEALGQVTADTASPRVLISGTADYSMLAHVLAIFDERDLTPAVTVTDLCETPLFLNRWYAQRLSRSIHTFRSEILEFQGTSTYDAVCSHSFLGQFDTSKRALLMNKWRELLRPGGLAVTVNRVRPDGTLNKAGFSDEQAQNFSATVLRLAEGMKTGITIDPRQLAEEAHIYAKMQAAYPVRSAEEIRQLFEHAGFKIERLTCAPVTIGLNTTVSGPTTPGSAEYACIIARRL